MELWTLAVSGQGMPLDTAQWECITAEHRMGILTLKVLSSEWNSLENRGSVSPTYLYTLPVVPRALCD